MALNLSMTRGTTGVWYITVYQYDGTTPQDLTGSTLTFNATVDDVNITKSSPSSGITVTNAVAGLATLTIDAADTTGVEDDGTFVGPCELQLTSSGDPYELNSGTLTVYPNVVFFSNNGGGSGSTIAFSAITAGTNTSAAMVVGTGASLTTSGSGTINATSIEGITISGTPSVGYVPTATSASAATWQAPTGGGGSPAGSQYSVQVNDGAGGLGFGVSSDNGTSLSVGAGLTDLSTMTVQPATAATITGTTTANATASIVGIGTLFTTEIGVGDSIALSSAPSVFARVALITDDTHLQLDSGYAGSTLGDGTSQTIIRRKTAAVFKSSTGNPFLIVDDLNVSFSTFPPSYFSSGAGAVTVPYNPAMFFINQQIPAAMSWGILTYMLGTNNFLAGMDIVMTQADTAASPTEVHGGEIDGAYEGDGGSSKGGTVYGIINGATNSSPNGAASLQGISARIVNSGASATVDEAAAISVQAAAVFNGGVITNLYGLRVQDQTVGVSNWAIKTGLGLVEFGDQCKAVSLTTPAVAVTSLPGSPVIGQRAFVSDSNAVSIAAAFGTVVANGGSTKAPVFYDGTSWRIG